MNLVNELRAWAGSLEETRASVARQIGAPDYVGEVGHQAQLLSSAIAAVEKLERLKPEMATLRRENDVLRGMAATKMPCHYCGAETMGQCPSGFPGCALADDLLAGEDGVFREVAEKLKRCRVELDEREAAFERVSEELNRKKAAVRAAEGVSK